MQTGLNIAVTVASVRAVAPRVREYLLRSADGAPLPAFGPGAHAELHFGSIHYWWFNSRDERLNDPEVDSFMREASGKAYLEDVDALQWIFDVVAGDAEPQFDLNFAPDKPALMMRRAVFDLAAAENPHEN